MAEPKLLLADDSVTIRKVVELTFADEGIDVTTVADAETAMQKFVEIQPDIVLVDIGLPGTTGYQICEMIKQDDATKHIPVLLLVGSFEPFDQDEAERVCSDGFLTKPFHSIRDLVARVWDLLGRDDTTDAPVEVQASEPTPDTADIENLYDSSFSNTAEIEEFDTVDDLLGDTGMDDELIEASSPASNGSAPASEPFSFLVDPESSKGFDWSADRLVVEKTSDTEQISAEKTETYNDFDAQSVTDDESLRGDDSPSPNAEANAGAKPAETFNEDSPYSEFDSQSDNSMSEDQMPAAVVDSSTAYEPDVIDSHQLSSDNVNTFLPASEDNAGSWPAVNVDNVKTSPYEDESPFAQTVEASTSEVQTTGSLQENLSEPSPELIALVTQRVIDRLSDEVIREIAKEAVPRIAEKLIREALEQEKKG